MILASFSLLPASVYPPRPLLEANSSLTLRRLAIVEAELVTVKSPLAGSIPGLLAAVVVVVVVVSWGVIHDEEWTCLLIW